MLLNILLVSTFSFCPPDTCKLYKVDIKPPALDILIFKNQYNQFAANDSSSFQLIYIIHPDLDGGYPNLTYVKAEDDSLSITQTYKAEIKTRKVDLKSLPDLEAKISALPNAKYFALCDDPTGQIYQTEIIVKRKGEAITSYEGVNAPFFERTEEELNPLQILLASFLPKSAF